MKNNFQKLVDQELSELCWNECLHQKVLHSLEMEEKPVKRKMTVGLAMALVLVLVGSLALATGMLFSPRYDMLKMADDALYNTYGISDDLLPFFMRKLNEEGKCVTYQGMEDLHLHDVLGDYFVNLEYDVPVVKWSLEGIEGGWDAVKLAEVNAICQEQDGYDKVLGMANEDCEKYQLYRNSSPAAEMISEEEMRVSMEILNKQAEEVKKAAKLTTGEMDQTARAAIRERFGLTDQQIARMELEEGSCGWYIKNGLKLYSLYYWLWQGENNWVEDNGIYIVDVNVETGAVEEIYYDNALLGNG